MKKIYIVIYQFLIFVSVFSQNNITKEIEITKKIEHAKGYIGKDSGKAIKELLKIRNELEKNNDEKLQYKISYELALIYMNITNEFDKAIEESNKLEKYASKIDDKYNLADIYQIRGVCYLKLHFIDKGLTDLKTSLQYLNKEPESNKVLMKKAIVLNNISDYYNSVANSKQELFYKRRSLQETKKIQEIDDKSRRDKNLLLAFLNVQLGEIQENKKHIDSSKYYYNLSNELFKKYGNRYTLYGKISALRGLSSAYLSEKNYGQSIKYATQALKEQQNETSQDLKRDLYLLLQESYSKLGKEDSANYYKKLYTTINDSIAISSISKQNKAVENLIRNNDNKNQSKIWYILIIGGCIFFIVIIILLSFYLRHNKRQKIKYQDLLHRLDNALKETDTSHIIKVQEKQNVIHNDTLIHITNALEKFEKEKSFLNNHMSLSVLASDLDTNTKYLSQVINESKKKNFSNYINALRIDYITKELYENPKLRKYKIAALAEIAGFTSREVFTSVFKKETGMNPSYFIKKLEEKE